jgi:hypothetical protein
VKTARNNEQRQRRDPAPRPAAPAYPGAPVPRSSRPTLPPRPPRSHRSRRLRPTRLPLPSSRPPPPTPVPPRSGDRAPGPHPVSRVPGAVVRAALRTALPRAAEVERSGDHGAHLRHRRCLLCWLAYIVIPSSRRSPRSSRATWRSGRSSATPRSAARAGHHRPGARLRRRGLNLLIGVGFLLLIAYGISQGNSGTESDAGGPPVTAA